MTGTTTPPPQPMCPRPDNENWKYIAVLSSTDNPMRCVYANSAQNAPNCVDTTTATSSFYGWTQVTGSLGNTNFCAVKPPRP